MSQEQSGAGAATAKQSGQRPSIGRIVTYNNGGIGRLFPAIIQAVDPGATEVTLCVFTNGGPQMVHEVLQGDDSGQWQWPALT